MPLTEQDTGYKGEIETGKQAALDLDASGRTARLRNKVRGAYAAMAKGLTADECALALREDKLSIRPRVSELVRDGFLKDSGIRRKNKSGKTAAVFVLNIDTKESVE